MNFPLKCTQVQRLKLTDHFAKKMCYWMITLEEITSQFIIIHLWYKGVIRHFRSNSFKCNDGIESLKRSSIQGLNNFKLGIGNDPAIFCCIVFQQIPG